MKSESNGLPPLLEQAIATGLLPLPNGQTRKIDSSISLEEAHDLYAAVLELRPDSTLEIGLACGISAAVLTSALRTIGKGKHHAIDPYQKEWGYIGAELPSSYGLTEHFTFHEKFPEEAYLDIPAIGFAFIDGSHLFDLTLLDFTLIDKKLETGGVIAFHDSWMSAVRKAIRYVLNNRHYAVWRPAHLRQQRAQRTWKTLLRSSASAALKYMPGANQLFAPNVLKPWHEISQRNITFLQKLGPDKRDWRVHHAF